MDCNKEEAFRAKKIAEEKMQDRDFLGARKIALKAQRLYPDLEHISQMLYVCDVHISAGNKILGKDIDWYDVLQVEQTVDEKLIKQQYRKFALLLHPDKNKFAGAEAAFKLIVEAQRVLLDKGLRNLLDTKLRASSKHMFPNHATQKENKNLSRTIQPENHNKGAGRTSSCSQSFNSMPHQQQPQAQSAAHCWTETCLFACPDCFRPYHFDAEVINTVVYCLSCKKSFLARNVCKQGVKSGADVPLGPSLSKDVPQKGSGNSASDAGFHGSSVPQKVTVETCARPSYSKDVGNSRRGRGALHKGTSKVERGRRSEYKLPKKANNKTRKKRTEEPSGTCAPLSSLNSEGTADNQDGDVLSDNPWRSNHSKRPVTNEETVRDGTDSKTSKRAKESSQASSKEESSHQTKLEDDSKVSFEQDISCLESKTAQEPQWYEYPDTDFSNFEDRRKEEHFKVGQIWSIYDSLDAMPRFYAQIKKVFSPGFKLQLIWLEPDPDSEDSLEWANLDLPYSCGKFKHGQSENTEAHPMFSHLMTWKKSGRKDCFEIYPRKGEVWALFKNWDIKWKSNPEGTCRRKFEYEIVEVMSEYNDAVGIYVSYLGKLKGFACLFIRKEEAESLIPPSQLLRFSHKVPSCKMTGKERKDVPKDSIELDPASIPMNIEEIMLPRRGSMGLDNILLNDFSSRPSGAGHVVEDVEGTACTCPPTQRGDQAVHGNHLDDVGNDPASLLSLPQPEFYDFSSMKSLDKFQVGHVWALYSDEEGLPKYYGLITKIDRNSEFKLYVAWLEACSMPSNVICWGNKRLPISCGRFKVKGGRPKPYKDSSPFSHRLRADLTTKRNVFSILPKKGEVWAVYQNLNPEMPFSDLEKCEYDIVEVVEEESFKRKVLVLERVRGYNSVFKARVVGESPMTFEISHVEYLRFSHQIPSYQLKEERGGNLRGCWELDPEAVPVLLFCTD